MKSDRSQLSTTELQDNLGSAKISNFRRRLRQWARYHSRDFPWRHTKDPYAIFVAEFLLQKTAAPTVAPVYETFLDRYPTAIALATAPQSAIVELLQPLGLSSRAIRLHESAQIVCDRYGGKIPSQESQLLELPGVGPYTARSICAHAFGQAKPVLDINVARILERFFSLDGGRIKFRSPILNAATNLVAPKREVSSWNLALLDFAAKVCTARNPHCTECPLRQQCAYADREQTA